MRTRILIALAAIASLSLLWGCGDDEETGGAAGQAGSANGGAAGEAGAANGGAAGEAGAAGSANGGSAGQAGAAGMAGAAGAAGGAACGTSTAPGSHTDCMTAGGKSAGHLPGKEKARSTCNTCHKADLGKSGKTDCWSCHDPASQTNLHNTTIGGKKHKNASSGGEGATNPECSACHLETDSLGGNTCGTCH